MMEFVMENETFPNVFNLTIDYNRSVEDGIKAGKYDWKDDQITSNNFPSSQETGTAKVTIGFFRFNENKSMGTDDILKKMDENGCRPATLKELLTLGEKHPDLQGRFSIIALGSFWQSPFNDCYCPCLFKYNLERFLYLYWVDNMWYDNYRFAAVRKIP